MTAIAELHAAINHAMPRHRNASYRAILASLVRVTMRLDRMADPESPELAILRRPGVCERCRLPGVLMPAHAVCDRCAPYGVCECSAVLGLYDTVQSVAVLCPSCDAEAVAELTQGDL